MFTGLQGVIPIVPDAVSERVGATYLGMAALFMVQVRESSHIQHEPDILHRRVPITLILVRLFNMSGRLNVRVRST